MLIAFVIWNSLLSLIHNIIDVIILNGDRNAVFCKLFIDV